MVPYVVLVAIWSSSACNEANSDWAAALVLASCTPPLAASVASVFMVWSTDASWLRAPCAVWSTDTASWALLIDCPYPLDSSCRYWPTRYPAGSSAAVWICKPDESLFTAEDSMSLVASRLL